MKILIIQQKMIGDVLTSSILFEALREKYPKAQLDYLVNWNTIPVIENNPFIDNIIEFSTIENNSKRALLKLAKKIQKKRYDIVVDVYSKLSSNIITLFSSAKIKISYYKNYSTLIYTHNVKRQLKTNKETSLAIVNRLQLLKPLGIDIHTITPKIYLTETEISSSKQFLSSRGIDFTQPLYMISVLGSGHNKTYPLNYMAKVIDTIAKQTQGQILFNYIPNQETEAKEIYNLCHTETKKQVFFEIFGRNLREFLAITKHCDALIGNEGGAINMAKALDVKTFAIYAPWISKATWRISEDQTNHISVHLKEYKPEIYKGKIEKELKNKALTLYEEFLPNFFDKKLQEFLKQS